ncbi:MAG: hypothetical protein MZV63_65235 [Marinilabiliales bacterium]|nr:hypothetical protein [Marinilabiliales bacterium]
MVRSLPLADADAVAGVDLLAGQTDVEGIHDLRLFGRRLVREHGVPDEEAAAGPEHPVELGEDLGVIGRHDVHEGEEDGGRVERAVEESQRAGVHDDLEQRPAGGVLELLLDEVDGDDLPALELADDALAPAPDVEDEPLGREIGYAHLELGMDDELRQAGTLLGRRGQGRGQEGEAGEDRTDGPEGERQGAWFFSSSGITRPRGDMFRSGPLFLGPGAVLALDPPAGEGALGPLRGEDHLDLFDLAGLDVRGPWPLPRRDWSGRAFSSLTRFLRAALAWRLSPVSSRTSSIPLFVSPMLPPSK